MSTKKQRSASATQLQTVQIGELWRTVRHGTKWAGIAFVAYCAWQAVASLAGKQTDVSVAVSAFLYALSEIKFAVAFTLAFATSVWAYIERRIRQSVTERLHERIRELELKLDPGRSSSGLTRLGQTNPRDRRE